MQAVSQEKENKGAVDMRTIIKNTKCSRSPHKGSDASEEVVRWDDGWERTGLGPGETLVGSPANKLRLCYFEHNGDSKSLDLSYSFALSHS